MRLVWGCAGAVWVGLVFIFLGSHHSAPPQVGMAGFLRIVLVPVLVEAALILATRTATKHFIAKNYPFGQSITLITGISLLCFTFILFHHTNGIVYAAMGFPLLAALVYVDKKPLLYAFMLNLFLYLLFCLASPFVSTYPKQGYVEIVTMFIFFVTAYTVCSFILSTLSNLVQNIIAKNEQIRRDPHTGLLNHSAFYEHLDEYILDNLNNHIPCSLIIWDIDNFKNINDTYGHDMGDKVILCIAQHMQQFEQEGVLFFRYGGDEFAALAHMAENETYAMARRLDQCFKECTKGLPIPSPITISAGVCEYDKQYFSSRREFFSAADFTLYSSKRERDKGSVYIWNPDIFLPIPEEASLIVS